MSINTPVQDGQGDVRRKVREYYGQIADQQGAASPAAASCCGPQNEIVPVSEIGASAASCCGPADVSTEAISVLYQAEDVQDLPAEVRDMSLGCGDPITLATLEPGQTVLDLGSGGGIDCFLAAKKVGETGRVIGVDMTASMIERARANKAAIGAENVEFRLGEIEHLPVADATVDVIISNCVINLSPDKPAVFREAFRTLKPGGRLAVSDIVTNGPMPDALRESLDAWAGCIGGAMDINDYIAALEEAGFVDIAFTKTFTEEEQEAIVAQAGDAIRVEVSAEAGVSADTIFSAQITAYKPA